MLALRQQAAVARGDVSSFIDVLTMSLGYYHEAPADAGQDLEILTPLRTLGMSGTVVITAAGNDSTDRPMYPAALTPYAGGTVTAPDPNCVPIVSVGALNPSGQTIALFSNLGPWVACHRVGAALVSTFPKTFNGSVQPPIEVYVPGDGLRSSFDIDDFRGGFGTWSGTSFAGPILAGEIAAQLCNQNLTQVDQTTAVQRGWAAVTARVPNLHP